jgi:hypothetical protein
MKYLRRPQTPVDRLFAVAALILAAVGALNFFDFFGESHHVTNGVVLGLALLNALGLGRDRSGSG